MQNLIERRMKVMQHVAKWANKDASAYAASDAQFIAWGSKGEPPKGVARIEDCELVQEADGRRYVVGLCEENGRWVPTKFEISAAGSV